ncbi:MAG: DedA family protein [Alphaproteobacteria bacterium]
MEAFIQEWGYLAVFLGSLVEGESVILTAGFLASQGYLSLLKIILISFTGTVIADQLLFFVGSHFGLRIIQRFPKLEAPSQRAFELLHKYDTAFILSFRFIYGIRTISPVIIGAAGVAFPRFAILNVSAAAIWSVLSCSAGYFFGDFLMNRITPTQRTFVLAGIAFGLLFWIVWKFRKKIFLFFKKS